MAVQAPPQPATGVTIVEHKDYFFVRFPYVFEAVKAIKEIPGVFYKREIDTFCIVKARKAELDQWIAKFVEEPTPAQVQKSERFDSIPPMPELSEVFNEEQLARFFASLQGRPFAFQEQGIAYNLLHGKTLNADQPGLGKTLQSIASVYAKGVFPCLVICPNSLKENWKKEWLKWTGKRALILTDAIKKTWPMYAATGMADVFIVNFESLESFFVLEYLKAPTREEQGQIKYIRFRDSIMRIRSVIIDEAHRCKNESTRNFKLTYGVSYGKEMVLLLTGTPVVNSPIDLWALLRILGKQNIFAKNKAEFIKTYCKVGKEKKPGNLAQLNFYLRQFCQFRREKKDVLKDLPPKLRQALYCDITNRPEYDRAENEFIRYLQETKKCSPDEMATKLRGGFMVKLGILKQIAARGKLNEVEQFVGEIIDAGEKVIIFCVLKEIIRELVDRFPQALTIYGENSLEERDRAVELFQTDPAYPLIVCNIEAGGVGLTLTKASRVGFIELPWNFAKMEQAEDRAHRIDNTGSNHESIQCTSFLAKNSIDQYCYDIVMEKKSMHDIVMGTKGKDLTQVIDGLLDYFQKQKLQSKEEALR